VFPTYQLSDLPERIRRNLDPTEKPKVYHRFHWAMMIKPIAVVVIGVFVTIAVDVTLPTDSRNTHALVWALWGVWLLWALDCMFDLRGKRTMLNSNRNLLYFLLVVLALAVFGLVRLDKDHKFGAGGVLLVVFLAVFLWALNQVAEWSERFFVLTNKRIVVIEGIFTTTVRSMPVSRLTDMAYRRTAMGRALGYGLFDVESAGQEQALKIMNFVRDPETVNLQISSLLFGSRPPDPKKIVLEGTTDPASNTVIITGQMDG
jgi:membrane protein YdbS with pleckstrin-like domain